jgi:hypothetical protein
VIAGSLHSNTEVDRRERIPPSEFSSSRTAAAARTATMSKRSQWTLPDGDSVEMHHIIRRGAMHVTRRRGIIGIDIETV